MAFSRMVSRMPLNGGISNFARPMGYFHRPLSGSSIFSRIMTSQRVKSEWRSVCGVKHQAFFSTIGSIQNQHKDKSEKNNSKITKAALLSQASNRFSKFLIHIKWPLMRNNRPFTMDDFTAFFSWLVMGNVLWIILGTTTFGLVTMYSIHTFDNIRNSIKAYYTGDDEDNSGNGDRKHSDDSILGYITSSILSNGLGVIIEFKKGNVLPELKDGMLRFKKFNVYSIHTSSEAGEDEGKLEEKTALKFKANVETMDISLSFGKWYEGKGLINELEIYGINGKVYKSSEDHQDASVEEYLPFSAGRYNENLNFQYDMNDHNAEELELVKQKRKNILMESNYEISHVKIHDSYVEIIDVSNKNPLKISIFNCDLPQLRGNRLLIDFFNANNVTGAINDSMFTIHKRQEFNNPTNDNKIVRFKLDGINMETISHSQKLKFNWIVNGKAEIIADIRLPSVNQESENSFTLGNEYKKISDICSEIFDELIDVTSPSSPEKLPSTEKNDNDNTLLKSALAAIYQTFSPSSSESKKSYNTTDSSSEYVIVNFKVKFYNLKASLPQHLPMALSSSLPFISLQDLRSLIAYVNDNASNKPIIIKTTVIEKLSDLYNIENLSQTKIVDEIVSDVYDNLLKIVKLDEKRIINEKSSSWSHTVASQLLLLGLGVLA